MLYVRIYCECASVGATNKCIVSEMECRVNSLYKSLTSEYQVLTSVGGFVDLNNFANIRNSQQQIIEKFHV